MPKLFDPGTLGSLEIRNRIVRSATAEMLADAEGRPDARLTDLIGNLAGGGVGLIVTGHMYIDPRGKAHPGMTGIYDDALIPDLARLADAAHAGGARIAVQINHAGRQTRCDEVADPIAPSAVAADGSQRAAREMTVDEIERAVAAYGQAARRVEAAGFDAVQIHGAHGYLVGQFLSPLTNQRTDRWGGSLGGRLRFLREVAAAVRGHVSDGFPVLIKLGLRDEADDGLTLDEGLEVVSRLQGFGIDAIEISGGRATSARFNIPGGVALGSGEAPFRPWARRAQEKTDLPILLVCGLRSRSTMDEILESGDAQFLSMCRPLICEPDLPTRLAAGQSAASCVSGSRCWPRKGETGISCKCRGVTRPESTRAGCETPATRSREVA